MDTWRINEITRLVDAVLSRDNATGNDAWFTLGRIYAVITTPDREIQAALNQSFSV